MNSFDIKSSFSKEVIDFKEDRLISRSFLFGEDVFLKECSCFLALLLRFVAV